MKNIWTIFKKEWDRVIKDKRLVITIMILPGLMIFLIYSFIGGAITSQTSDTVSNIAVINVPVDFQGIYETYEDSEFLNIKEITTPEIDTYKDMIDSEDWDLILAFDEDFSEYDKTGDKPIVFIYSNLNNLNSSSITNRFKSYLQIYQSQLSIELYGDTDYFVYDIGGTLVDNNQIAGQIMATLLPMLVVMFLFSGAMSVGPESIAGEKERGTISTLLITPIKRSEIAIGKILSLSVLSLISAISSFIGILASLPKLLQMENFNTSIYSIQDYLMILVLLFSTVFVIVGIISVISAYSRSLKEAGTLIMPVYFISIIVGLSSMFGNGATTNYFLYLLPIYNTVQTMTAILTFDSNQVIYLLISVGANLFYLILFVYILNKMFKSEKIMFQK
ncbi:MAG: ABC transporter permease subunit [Firmicutes bacterium]|nr:ABC transporter permease subunit [Bacillota bacterium]